MSTDYIIRCDMEGVSGVLRYDQTNPAGAEYPTARQWFMAELIALVEGLKEAGAGRIVIYDEHYYGRNIDLDALPGGVTAICGKPPYQADRPGGLEASFAGMILHGLHAKAGTPGGVLPHSYEHDIADLVLNGVSVGEIGIEAAIAGDFGVPTVMLTGDSAGVAEAEALLPGILTVSVKQAIAENEAVCLPLSETTRQIRQTAATLVSRPPQVEPYRVQDPTRLTIRFHDGAYLTMIRKLYGPQMDDDHALTLSGPSTTQLWVTYWQMKLRCQADLG